MHKGDRFGHRFGHRFVMPVLRERSAVSLESDIGVST